MTTGIRPSMPITGWVLSIVPIAPFLKRKIAHNCFLSSCQDVVEGNRAAHTPENGVEIAVGQGFGKIIPNDTDQLCARVESVASRSDCAQ